MMGLGAGDIGLGTMLQTPPRKHQARKPLRWTKCLSRRSICMSFSFFFSISHLYFRKDDCADYSCMTEEVHDEALDGQDARGHISAEHYNYNFRCHIPSTSANPIKLEHPLAGEPQPRVRTFLWLVFVFRETCQQTCSRGDVVHSCASKPSPPPLHFAALRVTAELIQMLLPTGGPPKIQTRVWKSAIFSVAYCRIFGGVLPQAWEPCPASAKRCQVVDDVGVHYGIGSLCFLHRAWI